MIILKSISAFSFSNLIKTNNIPILDLRDRVAYSKYHFTNSICIPYPYLSTYYHTLSKSITYYLLCEEGNHSQKAYHFLESKGYNVINVDGGIIGVKAYL